MAKILQGKRIAADKAKLLHDDDMNQDELAPSQRSASAAARVERRVPEGPTYEKNAAFAGLLARALDSWWSAHATEESYAASKEAAELLLHYGYATVDFDGILPKGQEYRSAEIDKAYAAEQVERARELVEQAEATTGPSLAAQIAAPIVREFGYLEGHASLLCLWRMSAVYCRLHMLDQRYAAARKAMEDAVSVFDVDSTEGIPLCLEGIICYLGLYYPELYRELAQELITQIDESCLQNGVIAIAPPYLENIYLQMRSRGNHYLLIPQNTALGMWTLTHKALWELAKTIQQYSLQVLADVDACCRELGIQYFLCEGALLGAVRHNGFIPWDDDIDVGMLRADYDRFVKEAPAVLGSKYVIDTYETNPKHWTISGKVQMTEDTGYISLKAEGLALSNGPFVDIFAFDESPKDHGKKLVRRGRSISALRALLYYRTGFQKRPSIRKAARKKLMSKFTTVEQLHAQIDKRCREFEGSACKYVSNFGSLYKVEKETFAVSDILPTRQVAYEGLQVSIPRNAEGVLEKIYGDWQELPPYENRIGKHRFIRRENYEAELRKHIEGA